MRDNLQDRGAIVVKRSKCNDYSIDSKCLIGRDILFAALGEAPVASWHFTTGLIRAQAYH